MKCFVVFDGDRSSEIKFSAYDTDDVCRAAEEKINEDERVNTFSRLEIIVER